MTKIFRLGWKDLLRGLIVAVLTALFGEIVILLKGCGLDCAADSWLNAVYIGATSGIAYLIKNFLSNEEGKFVGKI